MKSTTTYTRQEADEIIELIRLKLKSDSAKQKGIRDKIRRRGFHASDFGFRGGYTEHDFLSVVKIIGSSSPKAAAIDNLRVISENKASPNKTTSKKDSDEKYVIDLCDEVLGIQSSRQHKFDFLKGDAGTKLPVDAYYPTLDLVIEYRERQHTEPVKLFDRRETVSGVSRGEQRKLYDQRRRDVLPEHGIQLIEIGYDDFKYDSSKRIIRDKKRDLEVVKRHLKSHLKS
jgi:hypothetical protein